MDEVAAREHRITYKIVVDCYDEYEVAAGWRAYLEDHLSFPFEADLLPKKGVEPARVTVTELEDEDEGEQDEQDEQNDDFDEYQGEDDDEGRNLEFGVTMVWDDGDEFSAALEHIFPVNADAKTLEAVLDWHYWKNQRT